VARMNKIRKKENIGKEVRAKKTRINTIARGIFLLHEGIYPVFSYKYTGTGTFLVLIHSFILTKAFIYFINIEH
jgi:hypothetical protein